MKTRNKLAWLLVGVTSLAITLASPTAFGATATLGAGTPAVADGVQNLTGSANSGGNVQNIASSCYLAGDNNGCIGQTFTTGSNPLGYKITAVSVRQVSYSTYWDYAGGTITVQIFKPDTASPNGGSQVVYLTAVGQETATPSGTPAFVGPAVPSPSRWLTVTLNTPLVLTNNAQYGFALGTTGTGGNSQFFMEVDGNNADMVAGGSAVSGGSPSTCFSGAMWTGNTPPGDRVFVATMSALYSVTYNGNGSTGGAVPPDGSSPYTNGAMVTVLGNTGSLGKIGYTFAGWNTAADGSGTSYTNADTFAISGNTTLYAKWNAVATPPTLTAVSTPAMLARNQAVTVTATVTPGSGTVTNVSVDTSAIGGSAAAYLVLSATPNVWTNTFVVSSSTPLGATVMGLIAYDTTPSTSLQYNVPNTVVVTNEVWAGAGSDSNWSTRLNWNVAPPAPSGDAVTFAGSAGLTPNMNGTYSVTGVTFDSTAGSFNIGTGNGSALTVTANGIVNNSTAAQTLSVPIILSAAETLNAASGSLTLNSNATGGLDLTVTGSGQVTFASPGVSSLGNLYLINGALNIVAGTINVNDTSGYITRLEGSSALTVSGGTLNILGSGGWWPIGLTAGQTATVLVGSGGTIAVTNTYGTQIGNVSGSAVLTITNGGTFINNDAVNGLKLADGPATQGTINLSGGTLIVNRIVTGIGSAGQVYFNGGTLKPTASRIHFMDFAENLTASVGNGGAVVDTAGFDITIGQVLIHSIVSGDNDTDGGLTKVGNGTLSLTNGYTYTGPTAVLGGALNLNSSMYVPASAGDLVVSNATLNLDASGNYPLPAANLTLDQGAVLNLLAGAGANSISSTGNLVIQSNTVITLNFGALGANPTAAALAAAGSLSVAGTNNVINIYATGLTVGQFPLIKYASGTLANINGFKLGNLPPSVNAVLVNNTGNQSVDLNITIIGQNLSWHGTDAGGSLLLTNWDVNVSSNWYDQSSSVVKYLQYNGNAYGDNVTFGDNGYNVDGTNHINIAGRMVPSTVTVNATTPYAVTGAGGIDGSVSLVVNNAGHFFLGTSNNFTGGTLLNAGTLAISSDTALGTNSGLLTMAGGTLEIAGNVVSVRPVSLAATSTVSVVSGVTAHLSGLITGGNDLTMTGNGTLTLSPAGTNTIGNLKLSSGQLNITAGTVNVTETSGFNTRMESNATLTVSSGATLNIGGTASWWPVGVTAGQTATIQVNGGTINVANNYGTEIGNESGAGVLTINSGTFINNDLSAIGFQIGAGSMPATVSLNGGALVVNKLYGYAAGGGGGFYFNGGTLKPLASRPDFWANAANLSAAIRNGGAVVDTTNFNVTIGQPLVHSTIGGDNAVDGGLTKQGTGILTLTGANTYTGNTTIQAGTLALGQAAPVLATNSTVAISSGAVLQLINGTVTNQVTGLLTNGVAAGNGLYSSANSSGYITGAGYLQVGPFSTGPDLAQNHLTNSITGGGTTLSLSWSAGWKLQAQTNSLSTGLSGNWVTITDGTVNSTNLPIVPNNPSVFYRLISQ